MPEDKKQDGKVEGETPDTWEAFLEKQDDTVKSLYNSHSEKLLNTVRATRQERDDFKREVDSLRGKAEKGSELEKSLGELSGKLEQAERRASFYEEAGKREIGCQNPKVAFMVATAENLFKANGSVDWDKLKQTSPELFGKTVPTGNAGNGTDKKPATVTMNDWIRGQAGRK